MKINQIIREKRKALCLTQEQLAQHLGVSTPAVSKWESGSTYPDITLLPVLARLLRTDLNTLMSFQADLSDAEIEHFIDGLDKLARQEGYAQAFQAAMNKLQEYPTCERLIYIVALYLDGALFLYDIKDAADYKEKLMAFYEQLSASADAEMRETALRMRIAWYMSQKSLPEAEALVNALPSSTLDKEELLAALYMRQGKLPEAEKIWQRRVLGGVTEVQTALINMLDIAVKENRQSDADFYAQRYDLLASQFGLAPWMSFAGQFQLAVSRQDEERCVAILQEMLPAMQAKWAPQACPLYRQMEGADSSLLDQQLAKRLREEIKSAEAFAFIRDNEALAGLLQDLAEPSDEALK